MLDFPLVQMLEALPEAVSARKAVSAAISRGEPQQEVFVAFATSALATADKGNTLVPISVLLLVCEEYPQLVGLTLQIAKLIGGRQSTLLALALNGHYDPANGIQAASDETIEAWMSWWWAQANAADRLGLTTQLSEDPPPWAWPLMSDAIENGDSILAKVASEKILHAITLGNYSSGSMKLLVEQLPKWLQGNPAQCKVANDLLRPAIIQNSLGEHGHGIVKIVLSQIAGTPNISRKAPWDRSRCVGELFETVASRESRPSKTLDLLAEAPAQWLGTIVYSLLRGTAVDWTAGLEVEKHKAFRRLVTDVALAECLDELDGRYGAWILTDPSGTAEHAEVLLKLMTTSSAEVAATTWPAERMPQLLERFSNYDDMSFLPILAAVAQRHRGVVPMHMFSRLTSSPESEFRTLAALHLGAIADEPDAPLPSVPS